MRIPSKSTVKLEVERQYTSPFQIKICNAKLHIRIIYSVKSMVSGFYAPPPNKPGTKATGEEADNGVTLCGVR